MLRATPSCGVSPAPGEVFSYLGWQKTTVSLPLEQSEALQRVFPQLSPAASPKASAPCRLCQPSPILLPVSRPRCSTLHLAAGAPAGQQHRAGRSKSRKACAAEALAQNAVCFAYPSGAGGGALPITGAEYELFSPRQHGGEHGSGCALWTEKISLMAYH
jgi:hypothetical protein